VKPEAFLIKQSVRNMAPPSIGSCDVKNGWLTNSGCQINEGLKPEISTSKPFSMDLSASASLLDLSGIPVDDELFLSTSMVSQDTKGVDDKDWFKRRRSQEIGTSTKKLLVNMLDGIAEQSTGSSNDSVFLTPQCSILKNDIKGILTSHMNSPNFLVHPSPLTLPLLKLTEANQNTDASSYLEVHLNSPTLSDHQLSPGNILSLSTEESVKPTTAANRTFDCSLSPAKSGHDTGHSPPWPMHVSTPTTKQGSNLGKVFIPEFEASRLKLSPNESRCMNSTEIKESGIVDDDVQETSNDSKQLNVTQTKATPFNTTQPVAPCHLNTTQTLLDCKSNTTKTIVNEKSLNITETFNCTSSRNSDDESTNPVTESNEDIKANPIIQESLLYSLKTPLNTTGTVESGIEDDAVSGIDEKVPSYNNQGPIRSSQFTELKNRNSNLLIEVSHTETLTEPSRIISKVGGSEKKYINKTEENWLGSIVKKTSGSNLPPEECDPIDAEIINKKKIAESSMPSVHCSPKDELIESQENSFVRNTSITSTYRVIRPVHELEEKRLSKPAIKTSVKKMGHGELVTRSKEDPKYNKNQIQPPEVSTKPTTLRRSVSMKPSIPPRNSTSNLNVGPLSQNQSSAKSKSSMGKPIVGSSSKSIKSKLSTMIKAPIMSSVNKGSSKTKSSEDVDSNQASSTSVLDVSLQTSAQPSRIQRIQSGSRMPPPPSIMSGGLSSTRPASSGLRPPTARTGFSGIARLAGRQSLSTSRLPVPGKY